MNIDIKEIIINERYRKLDKNKIISLAKSIETIGLLHPIVIDKNKNLIAGNHRIEACKHLGYTEIECKYFQDMENSDIYSKIAEIDENLKTTPLSAMETGEHLVERDKLLLQLNFRMKRGDNRHTEKDQIVEICRGEIISPLQNASQIPFQESEEIEEPTIELQTTKSIANEIGMSERSAQQRKQIANNICDEVKEKIRGTELEDRVVDLLALSKIEDEDQVKVIEKLESGQKYKSVAAVIKEVEKEKIIEENKEKLKEIPKNFSLYNSDCRDILPKIESNSVAIALFDPPFGIDLSHSWQGTSIQNDTEKESLDLLEYTCNELKRILKKDAHIYIFSSWKLIDKFKVIIEKHFDLSNILVWVKNNTSLVDFDKRYAFKYENIFFAKQKGNNERLLLEKQSPDVLNFNRVASPNHPNEKPVDLLEYIIKNSTFENETVIDPFMGSGSCGVACQKTNRNFVGIELEKEHFEYAKSRVER
jgi:site-specific DNA-methyltransferase (adenine-specific)